MQALPLLQQRIVSVDEKGVVELITKPLFETFQAGEIHHKTADIQLCGCEPERETAAVTVNEAAMARMTPLAMTAGVPLEPLAADVTGGRGQHKSNEGGRCRKIGTVLEA